MTCGFKQRFKEYVREGSKQHTVRAGARWRVGMQLDAFENVRQKNMKLILRAPVIRVEPITIQSRLLFMPEPDELWDFAITLAGEKLSDDEANRFAWCDGFRSTTDEPLCHLRAMAEYWRYIHGTEKFSGQVVYWDFTKAVFK